MDKAVKILKSEPDLIVSLFIAPIIILILIIISPLIRVRVGHIHCDRIGHFAMNTELCYLERKFKPKSSLLNTVDFFYLPRYPSCNLTLENLWRKKLIILPRILLRPISLIIRSFKFLEKFHASSDNSDRDIFNLIDFYPTTLSFSNEEYKRGKKELEKFGLDHNSKFICIMVRDSAYLNSIYDASENISLQHDYRNNDIQNFINAADTLTKLGYYVFRMGSKANKPLNMKNDMVIDYPFSKYKSDFLDIFISANCEFCITTGLGLDAVSNIFRKPIVYVNFAPLETIHITSKNFLLLPKYYYNKKLNRMMTLKEIQDSKTFGALNSLIYHECDIELIENSSDEITQIVLEMHENIICRNKENRDEFSQEKFWNIFMSNPSLNSSLYGKIKSRIGNNFLMNNQWWLD